MASGNFPGCAVARHSSGSSATAVPPSPAGAATGAATLVANLTDPAPVAETIEALAFNAGGGTLYAVRDVAGVHT
ncbi:hypothetical protein LCGC14_2512440, partial [marine sediment metagenome]